MPLRVDTEDSCWIVVGNAEELAGELVQGM